MEKTVAVWFKGSLALYKVSGGNEGTFNAELIKFNGPSESGPPKEFPLHKEAAIGLMMMLIRTCWMNWERQ